MERFGIDKPDLRFGVELTELTDVLQGSEFKVFADTIGNGGAIKGICAPGCATFTRKQIDEITELVKAQGPKGLVTLAYTADGVKGSAVKFLKEHEIAAIADRVGAKTGDLVVVIPPVDPGLITPHSEAFQAVVWHLLVSHPLLKVRQTKWESAAR